MAGVSSGCKWLGGRLNCAKIPPGQYRLRASPQLLVFVDQALQKKNEVAGALAIDLANGSLDIVQTVQGKRDNVGIPRGAILACHTHPGKCPPRGAECALDVPSDADMALVMEDCMQGTSQHWVFSHTGTYTVALNPHLRSHLGGLGGSARKAAEKQIEAVFKQAHKSFEQKLQRGTTDLDRFRPSWMETARQQGFDVRFFPRGQTPETMLVVQ